MTSSRCSRARADQSALRSTRSTFQSGFTLIELLVAAGITVGIAAVIAVLVRNVGTTWTRASGRLGADAQARIVLDQLALDLQGALFRDDGNVWMAAEIVNAANGVAGTPWQPAPRNPKPPGGLSLQLTQPNIADARFGTAGVWLRFFTTSRPTATAPAPNNVPAPVAVSYQIMRRFTANNPQNQNTAYLLHRVEARPAATTGATPRPGVLESGYSITAAAYTTSNAAANNGSQPGDPRTIQVVSTQPRGNLDAVVAENVIDFGIRCYVRDAAAPGGLRLIFPANANGALTNSPQPLRAQLPSSTPPTAPNYSHRFLFPDVIDVMVRVLTDEGAARIANMERVQTPALAAPQRYNSNAQQWWWGVAQENSRVYTRRIVLR